MHQFTHTIEPNDKFSLLFLLIERRSCSNALRAIATNQFTKTPSKGNNDESIHS